MATTQIPTDTYAAELGGQAVRMVIESGVARLVALDGAHRGFVTIAGSGAWITATDETHDAMGVIHLVRVGESAARISFSGAVALHRTYGLDIYFEGEVVEVAAPDEDPWKYDRWW